MTSYVTAWAGWDGHTTVRARLVVDGIEIATAAQVAPDPDDGAVQALAEALAASHGHEVTSEWTVAPDPAGTPGDRRMVWLAGVRPVGGPVPCQRPGVDPDAWYPISDKADVTQADPSPERARKLEALAAELCAGCPVIEDCLIRGMREPYGIWGGTAPHQRRRGRREAAEAFALAVIA